MTSEDDARTWYVRTEDADPVGPVGTDLVRRALRAGKIPYTAVVCEVGEAEWVPIASVATLVPSPPPSRRQAEEGSPQEQQRHAVEAFLEGRLLPEDKPDTLYATERSRFRVARGAIDEATDPSLVGTELVGWYAEEGGRSAIAPRWSPRARAILFERRSKEVIVTPRVVETSLVTELADVETGSRPDPRRSPASLSRAEARGEPDQGDAWRELAAQLGPVQGSPPTPRARAEGLGPAGLSPSAPANGGAVGSPEPGERRRVTDATRVFAAPGAARVTRKQVIAVVLVPILLGVLVLCPAYCDRPSFTCGGEDCRERGLCTGHRGQCVVGGDADCAQSMKCQEEGACRAGARKGSGSDCFPGSDVDCAGSEGCRTAGRCVFWDQTCVKPTDRDTARAKAEAAQADRDVESAAAQADREAKAAGLTASVAQWFSELDLGTVKQLSGAPSVGAGWTLETPEAEFLSLHRGTAVTKGRRLPAYVVTARFKIWNRDAGQRLQVCIAFAAVDDRGFNTWREIEHFACNDEAGIAAWKADTAFAASR